jgi:hypothetical protein
MIKLSEARANSEIRRPRLLLSAHLFRKDPPTLTLTLLPITSLGIGELETRKLEITVLELQHQAQYSATMLNQSQPTLLHNIVRYFDHHQKNTGIIHCHPNEII